jgi:chemotaxis protein histidine kinase CheA/ActR/RegA family two-component response regulator
MSAAHPLSNGAGPPAQAPQSRAQVSDNLRMLESALHAAFDSLLDDLGGHAAPAPQACSEAVARLAGLADVLALAGADSAARLLALAGEALQPQASRPAPDGAAVAQALWTLHDYLDALHDKCGDSDICDLLLFTAWRRLQRPRADDPSAAAAPLLDPHAGAAAFGHALAGLRADCGFESALAALLAMEQALAGSPELEATRAFIGRIAAGVQPLDRQAMQVLESQGGLLAAAPADPAGVAVQAALAQRRIAFLQTLADEQARRPARPGEESQQLLKLMLLADELQTGWDRCVGAGAAASRIGAAWQWCESLLRAGAVSRRIWPRLRGIGMSGFLAALGRLAFDLAMSPRAEGRDRELSSCLIFFDECLRRRVYLEDDFTEQVDCIVDHLAALAYGEVEPDPFPWFSRELRSDMARKMEGVLECDIQTRMESVQHGLEALWSRSSEGDGDGNEDVEEAAALIAGLNGELAEIEALAAHLRSAEIRQLAVDLHRQFSEQLSSTLPTPALHDDVHRRRGDAMRAAMVRDIARLGELLEHARRSPFNRWRQDDDETVAPDLAADIRRALDVGDEVSVPIAAIVQAVPGGHAVDDLPGEWQPQEHDPEMMEVFLLESRQMLDALRVDLPRLAAGAADLELLGAVRRCFHTFKGSGRMVGLAALADAAQAVEMLLNASLAAARASGRVELPPQLAVLLEETRALFETWIAELAADGRSRRQAPSLVAAALSLRGEAVSSETNEPGAAPPPSQAEPVDMSEAPGAGEGDECDATVDDPRLREIFLNEARQLFKTLRQHGSSWRAKADSGLVAAAPPLYLRAVHTLRGCSAAAGFAGMQQLAAALDDLLEQIKAASAGLGGEQLAIVERAVVVMGDMLDRYAAGHMPAAPPQVQDELASLRHTFGRRRDAAAAAGPADADAAAEPPSTGTDTDAAAAVELQDEIDHELLPVFLEEGHDLMAAVGEGLQRHQRDPSDRAALADLRRPLHTVKGSARMAGALRLGHRMHELESGLQRFLAGQDDAIGSDDLLVLYDQAFKQFEALEQLSALPRSDGAVDAQLKPLSEGERRLASPLVRIKASVLDRLLNQIGEVSIARSQLENEVHALHGTLQELGQNISKLSGQLRDVEIQAEIQMAASHQASSESAQFDPLELDRFTHLQELTRMMAESVNDAASLQKQLAESSARTQDGLETQARLTRELQQELMFARMVKFRSLEPRLQHLARQLGGETGKPLQLNIGGGEVELDRGILERLIGPLEHLLRNAAVHGIEDPAARAAAGKPPAGRLAVQAAQEGNEAVIRISDDGRGLDLAAIRRRAVEQGLAADDTLADERLAELIFEPGFTTSSAVSALAGRGVGMDVVRSEVTGLGGRVAVQSVPGAGIHFTLHLPLSLAVKQVCLLRHGAQSYAIPSMLVDKVVQLRGEDMRQALAGQVTTTGGRVVELHALHDLLDEQKEKSKLPPASIYVMFVKSGNDLAAIMVDHVSGNREVVAKPIGPQLDTLVGVVGATILGNGEIALIINPLLLARRIGGHPLVSRQREAGTPQPAAQKVVMVVDDSLTVRKVMQRLLAREGYAVASATDGYDAIRQLHDMTPDLFLVDIEMPRMDGFTLVRHLRDNEATRAKPIVMITSRTGAKHRERAMEVGVNHYLGKPYQDDQLLELVRIYTDSGSPRREDDFSDVLY